MQLAGSQDCAIVLQTGQQEWNSISEKKKNGVFLQFMGPDCSVKFIRHQGSILSRLGSSRVPLSAFYCGKHSLRKEAWPKHVCFACFPFWFRFGCQLPKRSRGCVHGDDLLVQQPLSPPHTPRPCRFCISGTICRTTCQNSVLLAVLWSVNPSLSQSGWHKGNWASDLKAAVLLLCSGFLGQSLS